jgi:hypothetical protein
VVPKRSRRQIERLKKVRRANKTGRFVVTHSKPGRSGVVYKKEAGPSVSKADTYSPTIAGVRSNGNDPQPRPKIPLLSGGKDPTKTTTRPSPTLSRPITARSSSRHSWWRS